MSKTPPLSLNMEVSENKARMSLTFRRWLIEVSKLLDRSIPQAGDLRAYDPNLDVPKGYLECDGSAVDKTGYRTLYGVIGGVYGETATTFNVPTITTTGVRWLVKT